MIRVFFFTSLVVALGLASQPARAQQKLPTAADVLAKLKEKRERGGVQRYKLEFEHLIFQGGGQKSQTCRQVWELQIDWKTGKFREAGWNGCNPQPREQIAVYDGERIRTQFRDVAKDGKPTGDAAWKYGMGTGHLNSRIFQAEWWPVFFQKGAIAGLNDTYYPGHILFDPDPEKFFVNGDVTRDGRKCISLKTFPEHPIGQMQYDYLIDPGKDYAIVA